MGLGNVPLANAAVNASDRKFIFVFAVGGWDQTFFFTDQLDNSNVWTDSDGERETAGDISFVTSEGRANVSSFMQANYDQVAIVNGMLVRSVNHSVCRRLVLTGASTEGRSDWATLIGGDQESLFTLPSLVISGPAIPGSKTEYSSIIGRGDQFDNLLSGSALDRGTRSVDAPSGQLEYAVDAFLADRAALRHGQATRESEQRLTSVYQQSLERLGLLKTQRDLMLFSSGNSIEDECRTAVDALSNRISRCASVSTSGWDTHSGNPGQNNYYNKLFGGLNYLVAALQSTPGHVASSLAEETTVVVVSEMGRAPYKSGTDGKGHWMYTSMMLWGSGVNGNQVVGDYDEYLNGAPMDLVTGGTGETVLTPDHLGSTLLALADIDPGDHLEINDPITALLT